jgi:hypothetical protein
VLGCIGGSLKLMVDGGKFNVDFSFQSHELFLMFSNWDLMENNEHLCDAPICLLVTVTNFMHKC